MNTLSPAPRALELLRITEAQQRHTDALAKATGERFNVFQILRVGHLEVTTHSPILAELLNPRGKHGQGSAFLRLFLLRFEIKGFDAERAKVDLEYHVGRVTETSGGRIDILIRDGKGATVLIENKIYAGDQENQITRYRDFDCSAHLFYLTLDGREPSNLNIVGDLHCISYAVDIIAWLKDCRKESACVHTVRETITQYIHLLQDLTNQNTNTRMSQELTKAILDSQTSFQAYTALRHAERDVRTAILAGLNEKLDGLARKLGLSLNEGLAGIGKQYEGWFFASPDLAAHGLQIGFQCDQRDYRGFYFGFNQSGTHTASPLSASLQAAFQTEFDQVAKFSKSWPAYFWWNAHRNWTEGTFESIHFGSFIDDVEKDLKRLLAVFELACVSRTTPTALCNYES